MGTDADILKRLDELESQLAFQDELHAKLNEVVARQDREIAHLTKQLEALARRLKDLGEAIPGEPAGPADEVPPHY